MTNFEKWKERLNEKDKTFLEELVKKAQDVYVALTAYCLCDCLWCPLFPVHCSGVPRCERNKYIYSVCLHKLTEWANAEVKEDAEDDRLPEGWTHEEIEEAAREAKTSHPMTNFEKWKEELTVNDAHNLFDSMCDRCPARDECQNGGEDASCAEAFFRWAKSRAKEEAK